MSSSERIRELIAKVSDWDKDERYMAISDLQVELKKDSKIDQVAERRICDALLDRLENDKSNNVQSIAVSCLSQLLQRCGEEQVAAICVKLSTQMVKGSQDLRDIYSIGLKTLIKDVPRHMGAVVCANTGDKLNLGIKHKDDKVKMECLDVCTELLQAFGQHLRPQHSSFMASLTEQLMSQQTHVRKRASQCLGALSVSLADDLLQKLLQQLLQQIEHPAKGQEIQSLVQTIGSISRNVGYRLGRYLPRILPIFVKELGDPEDEDTWTESYHDLREVCLTTFNSFVQTCPREIAPLIEKVVSLCTKFSSFDPNFMEMDEEDEDEEGYEEAEAYSDDDEFDMEYEDADDSSWKVRKAAMKTLNSIFTNGSLLPLSKYTQSLECLITRFKEREESVRLVVLEAFSNLVTGSKIDHGLSMFTMLQSRVSQLNHAVAKLLKADSPKTKTAIFQRFAAFVDAMRDEKSMSSFVEAVSPHVIASLKSTSGPLRLAAMQFLQTLVNNQPEPSLRGVLVHALPIITTCLNDTWYRVIAETLKATTSFIPLLRSKATSQLSKFAPQLYERVLSKLKQPDIDQEIKDIAIQCIAQLVHSAGDLLDTADVTAVLKLLLDKLGNEVTRICALHAIKHVAESPTDINMRPMLEDLVREVIAFLRQASRPLRIASLDALNAVMARYGGSASKSLCKEVASSLEIIGEMDLHLSHLALELTRKLLRGESSDARSVQELAVVVLPRTLNLVASSVTQGAALTSLAGLYADLARFCPVLVGTLSGELIKLSNSSSADKRSIANIAQCLGALTLKSDKASVDKQVDTYSKRVSEGASTTNVKCVLLRAIGEIGRQVALSSHAGLEKMIIAQFAGTESVRVSAATALGNIAVGAVDKYLSSIQSSLKSTKHIYLMLVAIKEILTNHGRSGFDVAPHLGQIVPLLFAHCNVGEESVRNVVSECLGHAAIVNPGMILPTLAKKATPASDNHTRIVAVSALRVCVSSSSVCGTLGPLLSAFLAGLSDKDPNIVEATLISLNAIAHHQPALLSSSFSADATLGVWPVLLDHLQIKKELKHVIDLGPFKKKIDDGLPLRKAAFMCLNTMVNTMPDNVAVSGVLVHVPSALADKDEIKMLCHQLLVKLIQKFPTEIIRALDAILLPLRAKLSSVKKESGTVGSFLRLVKELETLDVHQRPSYQQLIATAQAKGLIAGTATS